MFLVCSGVHAPTPLQTQTTRERAVHTPNETITAGKSPKQCDGTLLLCVDSAYEV